MEAPNGKKDLELAAQRHAFKKTLISGASIQEYFLKMKNLLFPECLEEVFKDGPLLLFSSKIHEYAVPCKLSAGMGEYRGTA